MLRAPGTVILLACGLGFAGLVALDCSPPRDTASGLALTGAILVSVVLLTGLLVWSFGRVGRAAWPGLVLGVLMAVALWLLTWPFFDPVP